MRHASEVFEGAGPDVALALALASAVHAEQRDKADAPYIDHPLRVAHKFEDDPARIVALLHDVLEDSDTPQADLRDRFSSEVVDAVVALTRVAGEPSDIYYRRVRSNALALRVKLGDIHDNLEPWRFAKLSVERRQHFMRKYGAALIALAE
ncbi:MAG: HD domain-containing protein [Coriobacteriia bacterium]|nr:HD domain-containing protein [Coriobacteriia bacterium]